MDPRFQMSCLELLLPDQMLIVWEDGAEHLFHYATLRRACSCARCVDEMTGNPLLDPASVPEDITVQRWAPTGRYGASLAFSDGHSTGIYTWRRLRELGEEIAAKS